MTTITTPPITTPIPLSNLSVGLKQIALLPDSGTGNVKAARLNFLASPNDGSNRIFVNDTRGKLYVINQGKTSVYLDLKSLIGAGWEDKNQQQGFTYFAFHPDFAHNGIFYTVNSQKKNTGKPDFPVTKKIINNIGQTISSSHHDVIREWTVTNPQGNSFVGIQREILRIEQPYPDHNTGQLGFNPNAKPGDADYGMLYIATADGGSDGFPVSQTDPMNNGRDLGVPLGKILRIDPGGKNSANGKYGIPQDNPFVNDNNPKTLGEIWAYGFRNPHRYSWDTQADKKMLIADVGQAFIEEINLGIRGANYGWDQREGLWVTDQNNENVLYTRPSNDSTFRYTYPVAMYDHDRPPTAKGFYGFAVAGGYVYRGSVIPELKGQYVFGDFGNDGRWFHVPANQLINGKQAYLRQLRLFEGNTQQSFLQIVGDPRSDVRFGVDSQNEMYATSKRDGKVYKLVPSPQSSLKQTAIYINDISLIEGHPRDSQAKFTVNLAQATTKTVTVRYATSNGSAFSPSDYLPTNGTLTFLPGQTSKTITVSLVDNQIIEPVERFQVNLFTPANGVITKAIGTANISDTLVSSVKSFIALPANVENLLITGTGNLGGTGNNNNNLLTGNNANNFLSGGAGNDTITGNNGNDTLIGGAGNDQLRGGNNNDLFVFNSPTERQDAIIDFDKNFDKIALKSSAFGLSLGALKPNQFIYGSAAANTLNRLIYQPTSGALFFDPDGTGTSPQVQLATLTNKQGLISSNILVIA